MTTCSRCVMDDSDPDHFLYYDGVCQKCHEHNEAASRYDKSPEVLARVFKVVGFKQGEYDCVHGLSGGVDSSLVYHLAKIHDLHPYVIHLDNEWDKPVTTENIKRLTEFWDDELHVVKVDNHLFRRVQRAFFEAGLPDIEVPTDHAIRASLLDAAERMGLDFILSGVNIATESHAASKWTHGHRDWRYIKSVCEAMNVDATPIPHYTLTDDLLAQTRYQWIAPLNYIDYNRAKAIQLLGELYGYEDYGGKHQESIITRFVHGYILPRRFGYDTRRSRLSAMICSGQITRDEALKTLSEPAYDPELMEADRRLVEQRWGLTSERFDEIMASPIRSFTDYPSYARNPAYLPLRFLVKVMQR